MIYLNLMLKADRIVRLIKPSNSPDCDYHREFFYLAKEGKQMSHYKVQFVKGGLWVYLCEACAKKISL